VINSQGSSAQLSHSSSVECSSLFNAISGGTVLQTATVLVRGKKGVVRATF
jgi:hypothetical protein